jgi:hypothetical protein
VPGPVSPLFSGQTLFLRIDDPISGAYSGQRILNRSSGGMNFLDREAWAASVERSRTSGNREGVLPNDRGEAHRTGSRDRWGSRCKASFGPPYFMISFVSFVFFVVKKLPKFAALAGWPPSGLLNVPIEQPTWSNCIFGNGIGRRDSIPTNFIDYSADML